jgi:signal transduction histidine kinase
MIKKLQIKFIAIIMIMVSIVLITSLVISYLTTYYQLVEESYSELQRELSMNSETNLDEPFNQSDELAPDTEPPDEEPGVMYENSIVKSVFTGFTVQMDKDGNLVSWESKYQNITEEYVIEVIDTLPDVIEERGEITGLNLRYMTKEQPDGTTAIAFLDTTYEKNLLFQQLIYLVIIGLASMAVLFAISIFLSFLVVKPVKESFEQQRQFVADASHELKTPITITLANTSILLSDYEKLNKEQSKWIVNIQNEAKRMKTLVEELLMLAKAETDREIAEKQEINISDVVQECVLSFEPILFEKGKTITADVEEHIYISGNKNQIKQVITILLDNACKYSEKNSEIVTKLYQQNRKLWIRVNNQGQIIPKNKIDHIFDRFYKVDDARNRAGNSYGLGLAIAKEIVSNHKGRIEVESSYEAGTTFIIELPTIKN